MKKMEYILEGPEFKDHFTEQGLGERYFQTLESYKEQLIQVDATTGVTETANSVKNKAIQIAMELKRLKLNQHDIVLLICKPRMEEAAVILGCLFAGIQLATIDPDSGGDDLAGHLSALRPKVVFCDSRVYVNIEEYIDETRHVYVFKRDHSHHSFKKILENTVNPNFTPVRIENTQTHVAFIIPTEGVCEPPKFVKISHHAAYARASVIMETILKGSRKIMSYYSLMGPSQIVLCLVIFERVHVRVIPPEFEERAVCKAIHDLKIELALLGTTNAMKLATYHSSGQDYDVTCLKQILVGGSTTPAKNLTFIANTFSIIITNIYNQTECGPIAGMTPTDTFLTKVKPAACGKLFPGARIKIVDFSDGHSLPANKWGELCYLGPTMASGYYKRNNSNIFTPNAFVRTGDVAQYDKQKCIYIHGRIEEILFRTERIFSTMDVEEVVNTHPNVKESTAFVNGDLMYLLVIISSPSTAIELTEWLHSKLPSHMVPHEIVLVNELPKTKNGKVKKYYLYDILSRKSSVLSN